MTSRKPRSQRTAKGFEIPVPKRGDVLGAFEQIAGPQQGRDQDRRASQADASPEAVKKRRGKAEP